MGNKFKIGDKVKRLFTTHGNFKVGDIGIIIGYRDIGVRINCILKNDRDTYSHNPSSLKLIEEKPLDQAVRKVNTHLEDGLRYYNEEILRNVGTPPEQLQPDLYCSCPQPIIKKQSTAVAGVMTKNNTYDYCTTCKKERV